MSTCADCCDHCQTCISCNATCDTCQSFCQLGRQLATQNGLTAPWPGIVRDDIIIKKLPRALYNQAFSYVQSAAALGSMSNSGGWTGSGETRDFIYADKTNELITGINSLGGGTNAGTGPFSRDTSIVYASYFQALSTALSGLLLRFTACDDCNIQCNVTCNTCNSCDSCQGSVSYWPGSWYGSWSGSWSGSGP